MRKREFKDPSLARRANVSGRLNKGQFKRNGQQFQRDAYRTTSKFRCPVTRQHDFRQTRRHNFPGVEVERILVRINPLSSENWAFRTLRDKSVERSTPRCYRSTYRAARFLTVLFRDPLRTVTRVSTIMTVYGIIPARLQSTRLPRKLLLAETGRTVLEYTWRSASRATSLDQLIIAADSDEISTAVTKFGGRCELTGEHPSGTDRIAEVALRCCPDGDIFVNIQGDEPEIDPANIDALVRALAECPTAQMATLGTPMKTMEQVQATSCVKVVRGGDGRALYFSRCPIPFCRDRDPEEILASEHPWLLHIGIYAYRRDFLFELTKLPPSRLEKLEKLEQLRALEAGARIQVAIVEHHSVGIDTPEDYARFVERSRSNPTC